MLARYGTAKRYLTIKLILSPKKPGTNGQYWVLQLQDNTGKGVKVAGTQKSASSVFAEVKVPVHIEHIIIQPC